MMQQELTVDAALTGDKTLALQALLADPMTRSVEEAKNLIDELLEAHAENLPQFSS
jgi:alpha-galactosidase/6-phospho-beta-glucosidase family protein